MTEKTDYKTLRRNMPRPGDRIDRIENATAVGMPDINFCAEGVECWIEQKAPKEPKRKSTPLFGSNYKITIDQRNWMLRQMKAGGNAYFLISTDKRWLLISGEHADLINYMTVDEAINHSLWVAEKPVVWKKHWGELREVLTRC